MANLRQKRYLNWFAWTGIMAFIVLALNEAVFSREALEEYHFIFRPFWSYDAIMNGRKDLIKEHYLNVALFIPFGLLLGVVLKQKKWWWVLVSGCTVSLLIEILQLLLKRGTCELDDLMHNTVGVMLGYGLFLVVKKTIGRFMVKGSWLF